jgi:hypothetical protein
MAGRTAKCKRCGESVRVVGAEVPGPGIAATSQPETTVSSAPTPVNPAEGHDSAAVPPPSTVPTTVNSETTGTPRFQLGPWAVGFAGLALGVGALALALGRRDAPQPQPQPSDRLPPPAPVKAVDPATRVKESFDRLVKKVEDRFSTYQPEVIVVTSKMDLGAASPATVTLTLRTRYDPLGRKLRLVKESNVSTTPFVGVTQFGMELVGDLKVEGVTSAGPYMSVSTPIEYRGHIRPVYLCTDGAWRFEEMSFVPDDMTVGRGIDPRTNYYGLIVAGHLRTAFVPGQPLALGKALILSDKHGDGSTALYKLLSKDLAE